MSHYPIPDGPPPKRVPPQPCDACERRATQFFAFVFFFLGLCVGVGVPLLALHMSESALVSRDFAERCVAP